MNAIKAYCSESKGCGQQMPFTVPYQLPKFCQCCAVSSTYVTKHSQLPYSSCTENNSQEKRVYSCTSMTHKPKSDCSRSYDQVMPDTIECCQEGRKAKMKLQNMSTYLLFRYWALLRGKKSDDDWLRQTVGGLRCVKCARRDKEALDWLELNQGGREIAKWSSWKGWWNERSQTGREKRGSHQVVGVLVAQEESQVSTKTQRLSTDEKQGK